MMSQSAASLVGQTLPQLAFELALDKTKPTFVIVATEEEAAKLHDALLAVVERERCLWVKRPTHSPYLPYHIATTDECRRSAKIGSLLAAPKHQLVVASAAAAVQMVPSPALWNKSTQTIAVSGALDTDTLAQNLVTHGYQRRPRVSEPGEFSLRGDILDVFPGDVLQPFRIELFGDEVESIRIFDRDSQRTISECEMASIPPATFIYPSDEGGRRRVADFLGEQNTPSNLASQLLSDLDQGEAGAGLRALWPILHSACQPLTATLTDFDVHIHQIDLVAQHWIHLHETEAELYSAMIEDGSAALPPAKHFGPALTAADATSVSYQLAPQSAGAMPPTALENRLTHKGGGSSSPQALSAWLADTIEKKIQYLFVCAETAARQKRIASVFESLDALLATATPPLGELSPGRYLLRGKVGRGFVDEARSRAVLTSTDLFGPEPPQRKRVRRAPSTRIPNPGQLVVHELHGVGLFKGLTQMTVESQTVELFEIEYRGGTLYLPVYRMGEIEPFASAGGKEPNLDKLGGQTFATAKKKVSEDAAALAEKLLALYAEKNAVTRAPLAAPDDLYAEFVARFPHDETPDQLRAIKDIAGDLASDKPMDRLICGDVGFGKTEVAMRAAFLAINAGKQVAVLAPTTVLVEQHYQTFRERFSEFPVRIERMSRFVQRKAQNETVRHLESGGIDLVIGTHRLLSDDVTFKSLGLLIIDEEQRFGVKHKERLREVRARLDVLSLSATPIPRTLHFALSGLRDMSLIATPPTERLDVRTYVAEENEAVIRRAIHSEVARGGQVFFVVPRIEGATATSRSIEEWKQELQRLVPNAKTTVAHGQQKNRELEAAMKAFTNGDADILLATSLIENGLDIPRANTAIIVEAERFGMSQLYQVRGRVGRGKKRAYCYLLTESLDSLTETGRKRLEAMQRYTQLGAGFHIAAEDLEIRGAGDILGKKQAGAISRIGLHAFSQMLREAVAQLRGETIRDERDPEMKVDIPSYIPNDYIRDVSLRLEFYRKFAQARSEAEAEDVLGESTDRFGPVPDEMENLARCVPIREAARALAATVVHLSATKVTFTLAGHTPVDGNKLIEMVRPSNSGWRLLASARIAHTFPEAGRRDPFAAASDALSKLAACAS